MASSWDFNKAQIRIKEVTQRKFLREPNCPPLLQQSGRSN